jgi:hypothetical protein
MMMTGPCQPAPIGNGLIARGSIVCKSSTQRAGEVRHHDTAAGGDGQAAPLPQRWFELTRDEA